VSRLSAQVRASSLSVAGCRRALQARRQGGVRCGDGDGLGPSMGWVGLG